MKITPGNAQDIGARKEQQDCFCFSNLGDARFVAHGGLLAILGDGMGGMADGGRASSLAVRTFLQQYESKTADESIPAALQRSLVAAFRVVGTFNQGAAAEAGSTLVAAVVCQDSLYWTSVGDSHIYLLRDGELAQLNREHNYGQKLLDGVAQGSYSWSDAISHPEREHLTSYVGMSKPAEVDCNVRPFALQEGDHVILCSDGVYRMISAAEIARAFQARPSVACESIRRKVLSLRHSNQDNLTILALRCGEARPALLAHSTSRRWVLPTLVILLVLNLCFGWDVRREWRRLHAKQETPAVGDQLRDKVPPLPEKGKNIKTPVQSSQDRQPTEQKEEGKGTAIQKPVEDGHAGSKGEESPKGTPGTSIGNQTAAPAEVKTPSPKTSLNGGQKGTPTVLPLPAPSGNPPNPSPTPAKGTGTNSGSDGGKP